MRKIMRSIAPLVLGMMLIPSTSHAATETWTYVAASAVSCGGGVCNQQAGGQRLAPLGAFAVTPTTTSITIDVDDAAGPGVEVSLCQENNEPEADPNDLPNLCGDSATDDIQVTLCSTGGNQIKGGWKAGNSVLVSVFAASTVCDGIGTTGTAKVTF